ncbi:MAG: ABC transporter permease [Planctomycetota bacterium]|jgi:ribose/xylose/arabinose/galactoside ABC-type transport system permease subunit|nr:ABC transporter permease [Planctomycetota bacterium]
MARKNKLLEIVKTREFALGVFTLGVFAILYATTNFSSAAGLQSYAKDVAYILTASIGMTILFIAGNTDLSMGTTLGLAGYFAAYFAKTGSHWYVFIPVAIVVGVIFSGINGLIVVLFKVPSMVASLALMTVHMGLFTLLPLGGWVENVPRHFADVGYAVLGGVPLVFVIAVTLFLAALLFMKFTRFAKKLYAVGGNYNSAILAGISPDRTIFHAYLISGALIGVASILLNTTKQMVQANSSYGMEMVFITTTVVGGTSVNGGKGGLVGTMIGSFFYALLTRAMIFYGFQDYYSYAFQGVIILLAVLATEIDFGRVAKRLSAALQARDENRTHRKCP